MMGRLAVDECIVSSDCSIGAHCILLSNPPTTLGSSTLNATSITETFLARGAVFGSVRVELTHCTCPLACYVLSNGLEAVQTFLLLCTGGETVWLLFGHHDKIC